jgi:hypothetical protein
MEVEKSYGEVLRGIVPEVEDLLGIGRHSDQ